MAKFLDTQGISHHLQQIISKSNTFLYLVSPFIQLNEKIRQSIIDKAGKEIDMRLVCRKDDLKREEMDWLESLSKLKLTFCKDLHAKCYLNENEAIITSMNLTSASQRRYEMGIYIEKSNEPDLFKDVLDEVQLIMRICDTNSLENEKLNHGKNQKNESNLVEGKTSETGYCIRTGIDIKLNIDQPMCLEAYKLWSSSKDYNNQENFCHFTGEPSYGETSYGKPILNKNWKAAIEIINIKNGSKIFI